MRAADSTRQTQPTKIGSSSLNKEEVPAFSPVGAPLTPA
jgi:hypothetical protein